MFHTHSHALYKHHCNAGIYVLMCTRVQAHTLKHPHIHRQTHTHTHTHLHTHTHTPQDGRGLTAQGEVIHTLSPSRPKVCTSTTYQTTQKRSVHTHANIKAHTHTSVVVEGYYRTHTPASSRTHVGGHNAGLSGRRGYKRHVYRSVLTQSPSHPLKKAQII